MQFLIWSVVVVAYDLEILDIRPDHNLEDLRAKIFPYKRRKLDPAEAVSFALPARRKEKSLSSLVVNTPRVSPKTALTGRRSKATARKPLRGSSFSVEKQIKKDDDFASFISRETPTKQVKKSALFLIRQHCH